MGLLMMSPLSKGKGDPYRITIDRQSTRWGGGSCGVGLLMLSPYSKRKSDPDRITIDAHSAWGGGGEEGGCSVVLLVLSRLSKGK